MRKNASSMREKEKERERERERERVRQRKRTTLSTFMRSAWIPSLFFTSHPLVW